MEHLIEQAMQNDEQAISQLMGIVAQKGKYIALGYVKNDEMKADDIMQEAYIKAFSSLDSLQDSNKFESWFFRILNRVAIDQTRVKLVDKNSTVFSQLDTEDLKFEDSIERDQLEFHPKENFDYEQLKLGIKEVLNDLPIAQQQALNMYYFEGLSVREIAEEFDTNEKTVRSRIKYAKEKMKEKIEAMEKQGKSLRGVAPIPFLLWMLRTEVQNTIPSKLTAATITSAIGTTPPPIVPKKAVVSSVKSATASTTAKTTLTGLSSKAIAGIAAATIGLGAAGGYAASSLLTPQVQQEEKKEAVVGYDVISKDIPQFEEIPIAAYDKGYVVKVDNHYGFIDPEGNYKIDPDYEVITRGINENVSGGYFYCGFPTLEDSPSLDGGTNFGYLLDVDGVDMESCGNTGFGGTAPFIYTYDGKNVQIEKTSEYADLSEVDKTPKRTVAINASNYTMFEEYYIYVPETNEGFGPYKKEEVPSFDLEGKGLTEHKQVGDFQSINLGFIFSQPIVQGIFWVHEDGQYRIVSEHGEKSKDLYDEAKVISNDSILVKKGDQVGIVDENLEFIDLKDPSIEEMSKPIDGKCFIKKDGKWILVKVEESDTKTKSESESKNEEKEVQEVIVEEEEESVLYPEGTVAFGNGRSGFTFHSNGEVERYDLPPTSVAGWGYTAYGSLELVSNDGDTITYRIVFNRAEEYPNPHPDLAGETTRSAQIYENNITVVYHTGSNTVDIEGYTSSCELGGACQ